jgi:hypothetical protein
MLILKKDKKGKKSPGKIAVYSRKRRLVFLWCWDQTQVLVHAGRSPTTELHPQPILV